MDRDTIIRLAREAGAVFPADGSWHKFETEGSLEHFAALVIANNPPQSWMSYQEGYEAGQQAGRIAERERILEMCKEGWWDGEGIRYHLEKQDAIRSRT